MYIAYIYIHSLYLHYTPAVLLVLSKGFCDVSFFFANNKLTLKVLVATIDAQWGCRVGEVRAGTTSPMPDHNGFKLQ